MSRFIAVIHGWHVHSNGFNVHQLESKTMADAQKEACWLKEQREADLDRCAYTVIQIDDSEHIPRRLTWRERFFGKLS